jgi:hypothetical protein
MESSDGRRVDGFHQHDRELERRVINYLVGRHVPSLRQIEVEADCGTVTMRGKVYSFHHKQLCINCCCRVAGVVRLVDELAVVSPSEVGIGRAG